ncbi:MAG TPA: hypothetical protein VMZ06_02925 [Candidatus Bathyarchaeia archaeon]|nr:hypothetical protein [Candidatus Bathyarchaeia archaeon]
MTPLLPDTFGLIALLFGVVVLWVVLGRLILNILTGKVVQQYDSLDKHDPGMTDWRRTSLRRQRAKTARNRAA